MRFLDSVSIRYSGPVILILPVLLVVIVFAAMTQWQGRKMAEDLANQVIDQAAHRIEQGVSGYLQNAVQSTRHIELQIEPGQLQLSDLRGWREKIHRQLQINEQINSITAGNINGDATWMIRYPGEVGLEYAISDEQTEQQVIEYEVDAQGAAGQQLSTYDYDPRQRPWYVAAVQANAPAWSPAYAWVRGEGRAATLGIAYARPVFDDQQNLIGVVDSDISLKDISHFLEEAKAFESGRAFLVDADGNLIGTSSGAAVVSDLGDRIAAADSQSDPIARVGERLQSASNVVAGRFDMSLEGRAYLVDVRTLESPWDLDWKLVVIVPDDEIMAGVQTMQRIGWIVSAVVVLLTLALGVFAAWSVIRPVTELATSVQSLGQGNLEEKVEVGGHREFVELSTQLNKMAVGLKDRMRLRSSLALAMEIQQKLLPSTEPTISGLEIAGHSTYCDETGGDYYDFLEITSTDSQDLVLVLGDVMGHGIAAALVMATARGILRSHAREEDSLGKWLTHVNELLVEDTEGERFMTMVLMFVDPKNRTVRMASAGHDPPIIYDQKAREFLELDDIGGVPLGLFENQTYDETSRSGFADGTIVMVGTDGLWEAQNVTGEQYGKPRLEAIIRDHAKEDIHALSKLIHEDVATFRGAAKQDDDITFVLFKFVND